MSETRIEVVAEAIYNTHRRDPSPVWADASENVRKWVRKQAESAIGVAGPHPPLPFDDPIPEL